MPNKTNMFFVPPAGSAGGFQKINKIAMRKNIDKLKKFFETADGVLLVSPANVFYVTGYEGEGVIAGVDGEFFYVTDKRYSEEALRVFPNVMVCDESYIKTASEIFLGAGAKRIATEFQSLSYADYATLFKAVGAEITDINKEVLDIRAVKEDFEIETIKKAAEINDSAYAQSLKKVKEGMTEKELAAELEYQMRLFGGDKTAFDTICAFGANGSSPHAHPGDTKLEKGMLVTLDFGVKFNGYSSDITRTFAFGEVSSELKEIYDIVLLANLEGIKAVKDGMKASGVDTAARDVIEESGFGKHFIHTTGHGVGIEVHESPRLSQKCTDILKSGMVVTVEPGIYVEGLGGVRVEDLCLVTEDGAKILSMSPKELLVI